ncbi:MAG: tryptophan synthase subunit beta [Candidatus Oxydemutatoraceae bacterium WSBS_2016_MAG_OTU14]
MSEKNFKDANALPDKEGHFGIYGGKFVPETLMQPLAEIEQAYAKYCTDDEFKNELAQALKHYVGRPSPMYYAKRLSQDIGGAKIYLKREDLNHTGAHKINSAIGQALLAKRMNKTRLIAETGAGQHGVATATVAAWLGFECAVFMGVEDMERQKPNVYRMRLLGAEVVPVDSGSCTLKDAMNEAMRHWVTYIDDTFYIIGTVAGPHPYPMLVRNFQAIIGQEAKRQFAEMVGGLPTALVACVGGGSNALGLFHDFLDDEVMFYGVEAGGKGLDKNEHSASLVKGRPGVLHGNRTYLLESDSGQILSTHSISAGLDYPGVGPEHAYMKDTQRAKYVTVSDEEALRAFHRLAKLEGILPALESSHALAYAETLAGSMSKDESIVVNLSGRGDKDLNTISQIENNVHA